MKRISSVAVAVLVLSFVPVQAGEGPEEFQFGAERILTTGSGSFHVSGDPGEFVVLQLEKVHETGILWGTRYVDGKPGTTEPVAAGVDLDAPVHLDSRPGRVVVGWRSAGIWQVTVGESGAGATSLSLGAGEEMLDIAARGDDWNRVIAVLRSGLIVELDLASGKSTPLYTLPGAPLAASIASDAGGAVLAWLDRESEGLFYVSLDEQGRAGVARKLNTAPAAAISGAIGLRDGTAVVGWVERWADEDVAIVGRFGRDGRAPIEERTPLSTIGKRVTRVELASSGERMAVWDENGERRTVSLVSLGESGEVHCVAELDQPAAQRREWLLGGGTAALLFTERLQEDGTTALTVRELHCDGRDDGGKPASSRAVPVDFDEIEEPPTSDSRILGGVDDPCDGYDNDSDGIVDEGCDQTCDNAEGSSPATDVSESTSDTDRPSLVWTGSEYGVAWQESRDGNYEIYFARLDRSGNKIGSEVRVTVNAAMSVQPSLVWTGSEYGLTWCDDRNGDMDLYFTRLSATGKKTGGDVRVTLLTTNSSYPSLVWTGSEYGVAWTEGGPAGSGIRFARLDSLGAMIGSDFWLSVANPFVATQASAVWTGTEYGVAWHDDRAGLINEVYFARVSSLGVEIGSEVRISDFDSSGSRYPSLVWNGSEYGVAWADSRGSNEDIYFCTIDAAGNPDSDVRISSQGDDNTQPSLAWSGAEYGLTWTYMLVPTERELRFARLDLDGTILGGTSGTTIATTFSQSPSLVWSGDRYGVAWDFGNPDPVDIHFLTIDCCDDADSDGYTECEEPADGDPASNPGVGEACDGRDNDGDGFVDDGCDGVCDAPQSAGDQRLTNDAATSGDPSLAGTGGNLGVAWEENRDGQFEIYFARADSSGNKIGSDLRVTNSAGDSEEVSVAWSGSEYGLAWHDDRDGNTEIYFARVDDDGTKIGSDIRITDDGSISEYPSLAWNGSEYGVAWEDGRDGTREIYFARIDAAGNRIGVITRITDHSGKSYRPSLAWSGNEYGIAWHDDRDGNNEIYFTRVDALGLEIGDDYRVTDDPADSSNPSLAWSDIQWGVAWSDDRQGNLEVYAALIHPSGVQIGVDRRVTSDSGSSSSCSLTWTGSEYAVSFQDNRDGTYEIFLARLDSSVGKIGAEMQLTSFGSSRHRPSLVWTGERHAIAWYDNRDSNAEIYLGFVECCDDADGDGYTECEGDPNDVDPLAQPGARETCDGADEDGDGDVDEGCDTQCDAAQLDAPERTIYLSEWHVLVPEMAWTGRGFGVVWQDVHTVDGEEIYFQRLDASGQPVNGPVRVTNNSLVDARPTIAWSGSEFGIAWGRDSAVRFARMDSEGNPVGDEVRVSLDSEAAHSPDLVWTGSYYGLAWRDYTGGTRKIKFARLDANGNRIGSAIDVSAAGTGDKDRVRLVWTGSGFGVVWTDDQDGDWEIYFARLDELGNKLGSEVRVTNNTNTSYFPAIAWNGNEYSIVWHDNQYGDLDIFLARYDTSGALVESEIRVTDDPATQGWPDVTWTGSEYAVTWMDYRHGNYEIYFTRVGESGTVIAPEVRVTSDPHSSQYPSVVWTGEEVAIAWSYLDIDTDDSVHWASIACCDDLDGDTYTECDGDPNDADPGSNPDAGEACDGADNDGDGAADEGCDSICDAPEESAADSRITTDSAVSSDPAMVWTGGEYGLVWADNRASGFDVFFSQVDRSGNKIAGDVQLSAGTGNSSAPDLAWTGNVYGVAWQDDRDGNDEIYLALVDRLGVQIGTDIRVTRNAGASHAPRLAWNGSDFAVIWEDDRDGNWELYFARLDANGLKIGGDMRLTQDVASSLEPDIVWTGTEYGVAWRDNRDGNNEIYFVRLDSHGLPIGAPTRVTDDAAYSAGVSIAWTGTEYGVIWNDARDVEWDLVVCTD